MSITITSQFTYTLGEDSKNKATDFNTKLRALTKSQDFATRGLQPTGTKQSVSTTRCVKLLYFFGALANSAQGDTTSKAETNIAAFDQNPKLQSKRMRVLADFRRVHGCTEHRNVRSVSSTQTTTSILLCPMSYWISKRCAWYVSLLYYKLSLTILRHKAKKTPITSQCGRLP